MATVPDLTDPEPVSRLLQEIRRSWPDDEAWDKLQGLYSVEPAAVFQAGCEWVEKPDPADRGTGIWALRTLISRVGSGARPGDPFLDQRAEIFRRLVAEDADEEVIAAAVGALAEIGVTDALGIVLSRARHPSAEVRQSVAAGLPLLWPTDEEGVALPSKPGLEALLALCEDSSPRVRDWALFSLGTQLTLDDGSIRETLRRHVADADRDARAEAQMGLAVRGDETVVPSLLIELQGADVGNLIVDAATEIADPSLVAALAALLSSWPEERARIETAIEACSIGRQGST